MIHIFQNIAFVLTDTVKNTVRSMISSFGIIILIAFTVMYIPFRDSVKNYIETNLFGKLAINELKIYPRSVRQDNIFSPSATISGEIRTGLVNRIKKIPELKNTFTVTRLDYKSKIRVEMMGQSRAPYVPICGVPSDFFRGKLSNWKDFKSGGVPIVAPKIVLEMLNNYLSLSGLPNLGERDLRGFPLELAIYTPSKGPESEVKNTIPGRLIGFTDVFSFPAVIVPNSVIVNFAARHRMDGGRPYHGYKHIMIYSTIRNVRDLPGVTKTLRGMGLIVESQHDIADKTNRALGAIDGFSIVVIGILLVITVISIFNSYLNIVYTRSHKFSLKRIIGVSKIRIIAGFVVEAIIVGSVFGAIGFFLGDKALSYIASRITVMLPALGSITVHTGSRELLILAIGLSAAISIVSAFIPAIFASNMNLFKAAKK